jgi:anti-anti-sigma regulatory factor
MLRITIHHARESLTFQLEGRLAGPWVQELEDCWRRTLAGRGRPSVRVDLTGVTFTDAAGKEFLADLKAQGTELVAADCLMKALVAEITQAESPVARPRRRTRDRGGRPP